MVLRIMSPLYEGCGVWNFTSGGNVGIDRTKPLIELAQPMNVTFYRAFDVTPNPFKALDEIINLGIERILTAGQKNTGPKGLDLIKQLVDKAGDRIIIMPGSGINEDDIKKIRDYTCAKEFHLTGRKTIGSKIKYRKDGIFFSGLPQIPEYEIKITDTKRIEKL